MTEAIEIKTLTFTELMKYYDALQEAVDDIIIIKNHFYKKFSPKLGKMISKMTDLLIEREKEIQMELKRIEEYKFPVVE